MVSFVSDYDNNDLGVIWKPTVREGLFDIVYVKRVLDYRASYNRIYVRRALIES